MSKLNRRDFLKISATAGASAVLASCAPKAATCDPITGADSIALETLTEAIRPSGFFRRKAPALKAFVAFLDEDFGGSLTRMAAEPTETLRTRLLHLPGVGCETADAILLYALGHAVPVADEYLRRIAERHRLLKPPPKHNRKGYDALAQITRDAFAGDPIEDRVRLYNEFHALTVQAGKSHCGRVAKCEGCPLAPDLEQAQRSGR